MHAGSQAERAFNVLRQGPKCRVRCAAQASRPVLVCPPCSESRCEGGEPGWLLRHYAFKNCAWCLGMPNARAGCAATEQSLEEALLHLQYGLDSKP